MCCDRCCGAPGAPSPAAAMRFLALVSGGKDSILSAAECEWAGHEMGAMANLHPADENTQELDSHMYQVRRRGGRARSRA